MFVEDRVLNNSLSMAITTPQLASLSRVLMGLFASFSSQSSMGQMIQTNPPSRRDIENRNLAESSRPNSSITVTPHSPDLAPSNYFQFSRLKKLFSGRRFSLDIAVETSAETWLNGQGPNFYQDGLNKLVLRSDKHLSRR
ncbi:hypothetical protein TNCV_1698901 [Trichonephila clavipes]|nr:hypothetical protein TNCV_1698901 [Trichonephila clavipes]